jgi:pyridoxine 5-phosphate synthase
LRLGVNIDHVATLREARKDISPDPVEAALIVQETGADQLTIHLREDRRHINDRDLRLIKEAIQIPLNLEMALSQEIVDIACEVKPERVTLVPEKREEVTTEGGLDVVKNFADIKQNIKLFKEAGIAVSLFIDPEKMQIKKAKEAGANEIELHTGAYANAWPDSNKELKEVIDAAKFAKEIGLKVFAGHGLTYENVNPIVKIAEIEELNIGHNIIAHSIFVGLKQAVTEMMELIR